ERGFDGCRGGGDGGTGSRGLHVRERAGEAIDHREEDDVERFLSVRAIEQVVDVRDAQLAGEAGVDGAALGAFLVHFFAGVIAEDDVLRLDAEGGEVAGEDGRLRVHVEHAGHADAQGGAPLHELSALFLGGGDLVFRRRVGLARDVGDAEHLLGGDFDEVGVGLLDFVEAALDAAHLFDVFDGALFAGGDDEALRAGFEGDLGLSGALIVQRNQVSLNIDEVAQASRPMKVLTRPLSQRRPASRAAPMAPASPQCSCTMTSAGVSLPLKRDSMKSTWALTAARLYCVPPCKRKRVPMAERLGICETYNQMFLGSTLQRPAMISSGFQPWRWKSTMSLCMKTAQP